MNFENTRFIYQHMGLGDHVVCNGLVRSIIVPEQEYIMFVKPHNVGSVSYMYRDLTNLKFVECDDSGAIDFINRFGSADRLYIIGFNWIDMNKSFEENFYLQHGISLSAKWDSFRCDRDPELEQKIYDHYQINEPYIFVHDDNRYKLNPSRLPHDVRIVRPEIGLTNTIFGYAMLVERAKEVHCMESCFGFMTDNMGLNDQLFMHRYSRNPPVFEIPLYRNVKEIFT
jgi:hypothetical protein